MPRPKDEHPTPGELEVLRVLWHESPLSGRDVMDVLNRRRQRAYTSVMSLLNVMFEKELVTREPEGRAFRYAAKHQPEQTEPKMLGDLLDRVFSGSASALVARLLEQARPSAEELDEIRRLVAEEKKLRADRKK